MTESMVLAVWGAYACSVFGSLLFLISNLRE